MQKLLFWKVNESKLNMNVKLSKNSTGHVIVDVLFDYNSSLEVKFEGKRSKAQ